MEPQTASDNFVTFLNNGSYLVDPIGSSNRNSDGFAFNDEIRWTGKFPKIFVELASDLPHDKSFGQNFSYVNDVVFNVYFITKTSNQNVYGDTTGSYKNDGFVRHYLEKVRDAVRETGSAITGIYNPTFGSMSNVTTPTDKPGFRLGMTPISFSYRKV